MKEVTATQSMEMKVMSERMFEIEELESRFEMEVIVLDDGTVFDASADQGSEAANSACCQNYTCNVTVKPK